MLLAVTDVDRAKAFYEKPGRRVDIDASGGEVRGEMGPLINRANVERVDRMVRDAIAAGATVLVRGAR